jgi:Xaa-Pro dipeptidase
MDLRAIQEHIREQNIDGWLFCDFHNRDHIAYRVLGLNFKKPCSRRWFYLIPKNGTPQKLVHLVEPGFLDALPGKKKSYAGWEALHDCLKKMLAGTKRIAMQYSPFNNIPTISLVDAGTIELIRSFDVNVVSSADLVQRLYSVVDENRFRSHQRAGKKVQAIKDAAFKFAFDSVRRNKAVTEYDVQRFILRGFDAEKLTCEGHAPIVGVNDHAADPHFEPTPKNARRLKKNDRLLIDLWAKLDTPDSVYYDITWCGFLGTRPPTDYVNVFDLVVSARETALAYVQAALNRKKSLCGWQVDKVCRDVIRTAGFGKYFLHRTGHSIDTSVHGEGANIDSLETKDERQLLPGALFSIEPGIYKGDTGVRTEIDAYIDRNGSVQVEGPRQQCLLLMH